MNSYTDAIVDSVSTIVNQSISEATFDKTIQAAVLNCEDESTGKYKVKYQDSIFYAYSDNLEKTYSKNAKVYILVPSGDFSKTKRIIGSIKNSDEDYVSVIAGSEESYDKIGVDIIEDSGEFGLESWKNNSLILYDSTNLSNNKVTIKKEAAEAYMNQTEYFIMAADFRTDLNEMQKNYGIYGYKITMSFKDNASKDIKFRTFDLSSLDMVGQPYDFITPTRQFKSFCFSGYTFQEITKIEFYCDNFLDKDKKLDLFISNLELYAVKPIPEQELTNYHITLSTPDGSIFLKNQAKPNPLGIIATFKKDGKTVDPTTLEFFWFIQDASINTNSDYYHKSGGRGWRCLNAFEIIEDPITHSREKKWKQMTPYNYKYSVYMEDLKVETSIFKCVVVYDSTTVYELQEIINRNCDYEISIYSKDINDQGIIAWFNDEGTTDLECITKLNGEVYPYQNNLSYSWSKEDAYGNTVPILPEYDIDSYNFWVDYVNKAEEYVKNNPDVFAMSQYPYYELYKKKIAAYKDATRIDGRFLYNVHAIDIDIKATYLVTVTLTEDEQSIVLGTAKLIITNGTSTGGYILNAETPPLFKYNSNGVAPNSDSLGSNKMILNPLKFILLDNKGQSLTDREKSENFDIVWSVPTENSMITIDTNRTNVVLSDDGKIYNVNGDVEFTYNISPIFYVNKNNNTVKLTLTNKKDTSIYLQTLITFLFTKEGSIGTNGTEYSVTISLNNVKENTLTDKYDQPIVQILNRINPTFSPVNFYADVKQEWLKFSFWHNGEEIFNGVNSNTLNNIGSLKTTEGKEISSLKWEILSSSLIEEKSYFNVTETGSFSSGITENNFPENPCNIVKVSFYYQQKKFSAFMPIITIIKEEEDENLTIPQLGGFSEVTYLADGTSPSYDITSPFTVLTKKDSEDKSLDFDYNWLLGGENPNLEFKNNTAKIYQKWVTPKNNYNTTVIDNAVICQRGIFEWKHDNDWIDTHIDFETFTDEQRDIYYNQFLIEVQMVEDDTEKTEEQKEQAIKDLVTKYKKAIPFYFHIYNTIHIPIYLSLNKYSFTAINDWDGSLYTLNDEKDILLIPQAGAGRKENDNSFTGIIMGVIDTQKRNNSEVGLFGYHFGQRTLFADANTGKVELGVGKSKIIIDPTEDYGGPSACISANYSQTSKTGMLIDLIEPSIQFGNGNFSVDQDGVLKANKAEIQGIINAEELNAFGCFIGNFEIFKNALMMNASKEAKQKYYDPESHSWDFTDEEDDSENKNNSTEDKSNNEEDSRYRNMRYSADVYFGDLGLNIGRTSNVMDKPYFQVNLKGEMVCRHAIIEDACLVSGKELQIGEGGTVAFENESFRIDENGNLYCNKIFCTTFTPSEGYDPEGDPEGDNTRPLTGLNLTLNNNEGITYFRINPLLGIISTLDYWGQQVWCNNLIVNNKCSIDENGNMIAKSIEVDNFTTHTLTIDDYIFKSGEDIGWSGKSLGNVAITKGKVLNFTNEDMGDNLTEVPRIIGWIPVDDATNTKFTQEHCLELASNYKILINAGNTVDIVTGGDGNVIFNHSDIDEETGKTVEETYAKIGIEGLTLKSGGDTLISILDGTYNIPYPLETLPENEKLYDKIFSMKDYIFKSIYVSDPTKEQSIDLTSAFGPFRPEEVSVQLTINLDLKGIAASVSEIIEEDPDDKDKTIRDFYINYSRVPTKKEFKKDAITMHWTAFFIKK